MKKTIEVNLSADRGRQLLERLAEQDLTKSDYAILSDLVSQCCPKSGALHTFGTAITIMVWGIGAVVCLIFLAVFLGF